MPEPDRVAEAPSALTASIEHCRRLTLQENSILGQASARFDDRKRDFFCVLYAAMRVIDDAIDKDFLMRPPAARRAQRAGVSRTVRRWVDQVRRAHRGRLAVSESTYEPEVFRALTPYLSRSRLPVEPWVALGRSMQQDVHERPIPTWRGFLAYCEGASIAPGAIFIYVLGSRFVSDFGTKTDLPRTCRWFARDLAIFSYLVHILRDLERDAAANPQLLTIPRSWLASSSLTVGAFRDAVREERWPKILPVLERLGERAVHHRSRAHERILSLRPFLAKNEYGALTMIEDLYGMGWEQLRRRYRI